MLTYTMDYTDPGKDVSNGVHSNTADDPVDFPFTRDHTKGASAETVRSDINTYLGTQGRTGYDPQIDYGYKVSFTSFSDTGMTGILSSITSAVAVTSDYVQAFEATLIPHADDTEDASYTGVRINDISADGSADKMAIDIGTGWIEAILIQSGNILFEDYVAKIYTERTTNGDGYDLAIASCDGYDSGAGDRAGGNLLLYGGDPANAGTEGNVIIAYDGSNPRGNVGIGLEPTANMAGLSIEAGRLTIKETTTPTADADYGKVYCKNDNKLYFQDGAGVEHEIAFI